MRSVRQGNPDKPLTVGQLTEGPHPSPRQFSRAFHAETGQSPAKAIDVIARQTGSADRDRMRRAFLRAFGQPPPAIRGNARV